MYEDHGNGYINHSLIKESGIEVNYKFIKKYITKNYYPVAVLIKHYPISVSTFFQLTNFKNLE